MWSWQGALALLGAAWLLQCVGTMIQVRRYRDAFRALSNSWPDGWMGVGKGGGRLLRPGVIAMLVLAPDETVRRIVVMRGRTVFARAERLERLEGLRAPALRAKAAAMGRDPLGAALAAALDQIDTVRSGGARAAAAGALAEPARA